MAIEAQLADGRILEFPDGTDPAVIQSTVKRLVAESAASKPAPAKQAAPAPQGGGFDTTNPMGDDFGSSIMAAARAPKRESVLEDQPMPGPLPTEDKMLQPKFVAAVQAQLNALPEAQRAAALDKLTQRGDVYGRAAKVIQGRYAATDKVESTPIKNLTDLRLEQQQRRFMNQGMEPQAALNLARDQALRGVARPDLQRVGRDIEGEIADQEAAQMQENLKDAGFFGRVGAETKSQYTQAGLGLMNVFADITGNKQMQQDISGARRMVEAGQRAIPKGDSIFEKSAQGAISSLAGQTPMIALSVLTGTPAPVLLQAGVQQFGDAYGEARAAGQSPEAAAARAIPMAAAEIFFERFGMEKAMAGLRKFVADAAAKGQKVTGNEIAEYLGKAVAKEIPSEMATTATQYGIDVLPGVGLNKNPSLVGLYQQLEETLRQTIIQAGTQAGVTLGVTKGVQKLGEALRSGAPKYERPDDLGYYQALLTAKSKGFLVPNRANQMVPPGQTAEAPTAEAPTAEAPPAAVNVPRAPDREAEREEKITALTTEIEATGVPTDDARVQAEQTLAADEAKKRKALAPRIIELTQDFVAGGIDPQQANQMAIQQAMEEAEADEQAEREGAFGNAPAVTPADRTGAGVAGQPSGVAPTGGAGVAEPSGVDATGQTAPSTVAGKGKQSGALTAEPPSAAPNEAWVNNFLARQELLGKAEEIAKESEKLLEELNKLPFSQQYDSPLLQRRAELDAQHDKILAQIDALDAARKELSTTAPKGEQPGALRVKKNEKNGTTTTAYAVQDEDGNSSELNVVRNADGSVSRVFEKVTRDDGKTAQFELDNSYGPGVDDARIISQSNRTPIETPKAKRGRPAKLTEEEKQQRSEDKKPVQAAKARAERALIRLTKTLDALATAPDEGEFESDEEYEAALAEHRAKRRETIKELLQLQGDPLLRGTMVGERIKVALARPDVSEKEKADLKAGIEAQKRAQAALQGERPSSSRATKGKPDTTFSKFTNGVQALNHIIKTGTDFQKKLGKRLRGFVTNVKFVVIEEGQELPAQLKSAKNARQWERSIALYIENYNTGERVIYVRGTSFGENQGINNLTILHELLHAATNRKIVLAIQAIKKGVDLNSPLVRSAADLLRTMNSAIDTFNDLLAKGRLPKYISLLADRGEALEDPREFIAYGMTDPEFQEFLMQAYGYEQDTSFFTSFVRGVRELFNMDEDTTNAFTDLIVVTDTILSSRAPQNRVRGEQASSMFGFGKKEEPVPADKPLPDETIVKARPSANVQRLAKMLGSKLYGTPRDIAAVSIKELFQNSFDAIKGSLEQGQLTKGRIDVKIDDTDRSIRIVDNGLGMPTSVMGNQFLQIAGTVKETKRASGGLGVAKMLFLFENKQLEVVSLRDGVISRMVTSGDDLKAALDDPDRGPNIERTSDPETVRRYVETLFPDGHGTAVTVTIPETFTNESTGEQEKIPFSRYSLSSAPVLEYSPLFGDIDVGVDTGWGPEPVQIGSKFPVDKYTPFANVKFAWGTARIYVSKDKMDVPYNGNTHVLSNGLWQFDTSIKDRPGFDGQSIKRAFYIDVTPAENVKPEDAGYPFDLNRQNFSAVAKGDFSKIFNYITAIYSQLDLAAGVKNFGTVQYVNADGSLTKSESLEPSTPPTDNAFTLIKPGDQVEVRDGVLYVNNRALPELTAKDLEKTSVRIDELTIPQDKIDPTKVMVHDNTVVSTSAGVVSEEDAKKALDDMVASNPPGSGSYYGFYDLGNGRFWLSVYDANGVNTNEYSGVPSEILGWATLNNLPVQVPTGTPQSLSDLARDTFGAARVNKYMAAIGNTFHLLRDALISADSSYANLSTQAFGVSLDIEYYGVSIMVPFKGMFINPATTDLRGTPAQVAVSMIGTMVHEMAHYRVRNHGGDFASEMQKIMTLLDTHPSFDLQQTKKDLTKVIADSDDIFQFLNKEFRSGNLKPRGNRFSDSSYQQIGNEGPLEPVEGEREEGQGESGVSAGVGASAQSVGQVGQPAGNGGQTQAVGNAVRTQGQLNRAVKVANHKFEESQNGEEYSKGLSALQMMQDPRKLIPVIRDLFQRMNFGTRTALTYAMTTDFLAELASKDVPELLNTQKLMQKMSGMTQVLLKAAGDLTNDIARAFRKDPTLRAKLDKLAHMATLAEYDPADKTQTTRSKTLDQQYDDLGPEGQRIYNRIKKHFEVLSNYFSKLLDDQITQSGLPMAEQANLIKKIRAIYETGSKITPYFPLVRRGDYWLSIGKGETRMFFMFESMGERDRAMQGFADEKIKQKAGESDAAFQKRRKENLEQLLTDEDFNFGNDISSLRRTTVGNSQLLTGVFGEIDRVGAGTEFTPEAKEQLKDAVYQIYLQTMPEQSFRKQFLHRKGFAGFRTDLLRNVADTTTKMATQLARIKYAPLLRNSLSQARDSIKNRPMYEPYVATFERRVSDALSAGKPSLAESIAGMSNKFSFIYYLGGISSAMLQPLSLFQTGIPVLMKYGVGNAYAEMGNMLKVWKEYGVMQKNADGTYSWVAPSIENTTRSADERRAIKDMLARDITTSTYARDALDYKAAPTDKIPSPKVQFAKDTVSALVLGGLMHSTERLSREAMFLAAYRLNRKAGRDHETSVDNATEDTNEALGNYGQYNRPDFMKGAPGKVLTQFMMYPVHMTLFLGRNFVEMVKPMDGRTRWEATKKFFGTMGHTWVLGGAVGLWGFSTVMGLLGAMWNSLKDDEWPEEVKNMSYELWWRTVWLKEQLGGTQIAGVDLADIVERGPVNAITGVDISSRVSLNNMWMRDTKETATLRESATAMALEKAGPTANMILSYADAYDAFMQGDYKKGALKIAPAGFRNYINTYSYWKEGAKDNKGAEILSRDAFTTGELIFQAVGFRSDLLANTQYVTFKVIGLEQKILNDRAKIMNKMDRAYREQNFKEYTDYYDEMNKFNRKYPTYVITPENLMESLERKQEQRGKSFRGVVLTEKNVGPFAEALLPSRIAADKREEKNRQK